jgi:hypothetical protein
MVLDFTLILFGNVLQSCVGAFHSPAFIAFWDTFILNNYILPRIPSGSTLVDSTIGVNTQVKVYADGVQVGVANNTSSVTYSVGLLPTSGCHLITAIATTTISATYHYSTPNPPGPPIINTGTYNNVFTYQEYAENICVPLIDQIGFNGQPPVFDIVFDTNDAVDCSCLTFPPNLLLDPCKGTLEVVTPFTYDNVGMTVTVQSNDGGILYPPITKSGNVIDFQCLPAGSPSTTYLLTYFYTQYSSLGGCCGVDEVSNCTTTPTTVTFVVPFYTPAIDFNIVGNSSCGNCYNSATQCIDTYLNQPVTINITTLVFPDPNNTCSIQGIDPYAKVIIKNDQTGAIYNYVVTTIGSISFTPIACGLYTVTAEIFTCCSDYCVTKTENFNVIDYVPQLDYMLSGTCDGSCQCVPINQDLIITPIINIPDQFKTTCCNFQPGCPAIPAIGNPVVVEGNNYFTAADNGTFQFDYSGVLFYDYPPTSVSIQFDVTQQKNVLVVTPGDCSDTTIIYSYTSVLPNTTYNYSMLLYVDVPCTLYSSVGNISLLAGWHTYTGTFTTPAFPPSSPFAVSFRFFPNVPCPSVFKISNISITDNGSCNIAPGCRSIDIQVLDSTGAIIEETGSLPIDSVIHWTPTQNGCYTINLNYYGCCGTKLSKSFSICTELTYRLISTGCNTVNWTACQSTSNAYPVSLYNWRVTATDVNTQTVVAQYDNGTTSPPLYQYPDQYSFTLPDGVYIIELQFYNPNGQPIPPGTVPSDYSVGYVASCNTFACLSQLANQIVCNNTCKLNEDLSDYLNEVTLIMFTLSALDFKFFFETRYQSTLQSDAQTLLLVAAYMKKIIQICTKCKGFTEEDCGCSGSRYSDLVNPAVPPITDKLPHHGFGYN